MSINIKIVEKIIEKTEEDKNTKDFLISILEKESEGLSFYKNEYKQLIDKNKVGWEKK